MQPGYTFFLLLIFHRFFGTETAEEMPALLHSKDWGSLQGVPESDILVSGRYSQQRAMRF